MEFGELLKEITLLLNALYRRSVLQNGETLSQLFILSSIPDGGIDMSSLSRKLGLDNSTTTRLVNRLEGNGLVYREKQKEDRRVTTVKLSPDGEQLADGVENMLDSFGDGIIENIPEEKREEVTESLEMLLWSLSKEKLRVK